VIVGLFSTISQQYNRYLLINPRQRESEWRRIPVRSSRQTVVPSLSRHSPVIFTSSGSASTRPVDYAMLGLIEVIPDDMQRQVRLF
jgi:hypothetical protein